MNDLTVHPHAESGIFDFPRSVDDLFARFWGGLAPVRTRNAWRPLVDIVETPQAYHVRVEIPGVDPEDVDVTLTGDTLTIRGEKSFEQKLEDQSWCLNERSGGRFERSFTLPAPVSAKDIEADASHGILSIKVLKAREAQPQKISIRKG